MPVSQLLSLPGFDEEIPRNLLRGISRAISLQATENWLDIGCNSVITQQFAKTSSIMEIRPVTPEAAGSSPVDPANSLALLGRWRSRRAQARRRVLRTWRAATSPAGSPTHRVIHSPAGQHPLALLGRLRSRRAQARRRVLRTWRAASSPGGRSCLFEDDLSRVPCCNELPVLAAILVALHLHLVGALYLLQ
jgi:hypothetical protein